MNLTCVICADFLNQTSDVLITTCGHMFHHHCLRQWLERSKTCPQCRSKCSERNINKVYFNVAQVDPNTVDLSTLQQRLDDATLEIRTKGNELQSAFEEIDVLKSVRKKSMKTISGLEKELEKKNFLLFSLSDQVKTLQADNKILEEHRKEIKELKEKNNMLTLVHDVLVAASEDVEAMLKEEHSVKTLALLVSALKRELRICETKKTELRNCLKTAQKDLRNERKHKECLEAKISELESVKYRLKEKLRSLKIARSLKSDIENELSHKSQSVISLDDSDLIPVVKESAKESPGISERIKIIEESNSPYLNIKSSSIGLMKLLENNIRNKDETKSSNKVKIPTIRAASSDLSEKYSIFKKPRLEVGVTQLLKSDQLTYDGTGGSKKSDEFPDFGSTHDREPFSRIGSKTSLSDRLKHGRLKRFPTMPESKATLKNYCDAIEID